jgi:MFS family permease
VPAAPAAATTTWRQVLNREHLPLTIGLVFLEFMSGIQYLVVDAVMPRVQKEIGGIGFYGAVFGGYMLAGLVSIPLSGRQADRMGPLRPFVTHLAIFIGGTLLCALAPTMPLLAAARLVQGYGGGALYSLAYGILAKVYPAHMRPRMVALLTVVWVVSGVIGPGYGTLVAQTVGWRWAFLSVAPLAILSGALLVPNIRGISGSGDELAKMPLRWPLQLAAGCALVLAGLSTLAWPGFIAGAVGIVLVAMSLRHVLPPGTLTGRPGLPAAVGGAFLLSLAFFTADSFVPLVITGVRGRSLTEAGVVVSLVAVSWSVATVWQARVVDRFSYAWMVRTGSLILAGGTAVFALAIVGAPLPLAYAAWTIAGAGMGIAFPTLFIATMNRAGAGEEAGAVAARFVSGRIGIVLGTGLAGVAVGATQAMHAPLGIGLGAAMGLAVAGALVGSLLAPLLDREELPVASP